MGVGVRVRVRGGGRVVRVGGGGRVLGVGGGGGVHVSHAHIVRGGRMRTPNPPLNHPERSGVVCV